MFTVAKFVFVLIFAQNKLFSTRFLIKIKRVHPYYYEIKNTEIDGYT